MKQKDVIMTMMLMIIFNCVVECLINENQLGPIFQLRPMPKVFHYRIPTTRRKQDLNLWKTWVQTVWNDVMRTPWNISKYRFSLTRIFCIKIFGKIPVRENSYSGILYAVPSSNNQEYFEVITKWYTGIFSF